MSRITVDKNEVVLKYVGNELKETFEAGTHVFFDLTNRGTTLVRIRKNPAIKTFHSEEAITQDSVSLRYSFSIEYQVTDHVKYADSFYTNYHIDESPLILEIRLLIKEEIAKRTLDENIEDFGQSSEISCEELKKSMKDRYGITAKKIVIASLALPKNIQNIMNQRIESKVRAEIELENARTIIASARARKNAADMLKDDPTGLYLYYLETIQTIARSNPGTKIDIVAPHIPHSK